MTSRMQAAQYLRKNLATDSDRQLALQRVAAWLVMTGRTRQTKYVERDLARALAGEGYVFASITSAKALSAQTLAAAREYVADATGAQTVELAQYVDPSVIGGARIETPIGTLDETVKQRLMTIVRGMNE